LIIAFNSFLHHIPDYISLIKKAIGHLSEKGVIFTFQDPIYYSTLSKFQLNFSKIAYFSWRITQGDIYKGINRRRNRNKGNFNDPKNDIEYHVVRDGVNQDEIINTLNDLGFKTEYYPYFSTQSRIFQWVGRILKIKNSFGIISKRIIESEICNESITN
jgi:hypothetical protein